jgi:hypothetical protein
METVMGQTHGALVFGTNYDRMTGVYIRSSILCVFSI